MGVFTVRRGLGLNSRELRLGDRVFARGAEINTDDFPQFTASEWKRWEQHRLIESAEAVPDARRKAIARQAREMERERARTETPAESDESAPALGCGLCDFVAKSPHGLLVHSGRKHREPAEADS